MAKFKAITATNAGEDAAKQEPLYTSGNAK
jgi:hypothetical protein